MALLESIRLELDDEHVSLGVALQHLPDELVAGVLPQPSRQVLELSQQPVNLVPELPGLDRQPGHVFRFPSKNGLRGTIRSLTTSSLLHFA